MKSLSLTLNSVVLAVGTFLLLVLSSCAPGTDGVVIASTSIEDADDTANYGSEPIEVQLPTIPVVRLPDLSTVGDYDELLQERLASVALQPLAGVEVLTVECGDGDKIYSGDQSSDLFSDEGFYGETFSFDIDPDTGTSSFARDDFGTRTRLTTNFDGSGTFIEEGYDSYLSIETGDDGAGRYYHEQAGLVTTIEAAADGSGVFYRRGEEADVVVTVTLRPDGSGALYSKTANELVTVDAHADGSGDMYFESGGRTATLRVRADGSWELSDTSFGTELVVTVDAEGAGEYLERGSRNIALDFAADGSTVGPAVVLPPTPTFVVADRLPTLGTLTTFSPPCATVLRFDSALLFDINESAVRPEAAAVLAEVAPALIEAGRTIDINGHTDATGSDDYNSRLSLARAEAVAVELRSHGVEVEMSINGFGESQPVAANFNADGSADEAGQRQNRRVEIVIRES